MSQDLPKRSDGPPPAGVLAQARAIVHDAEAARWSEDEWHTGLVRAVLDAQCRAANRSPEPLH
jgi:hypothetical protein